MKSKLQFSYISIKTLEKGKRIQDNRLNHFQTSTGFHVSAIEVFRKHWENEKLLITSNFSFSHCVFYQFGELSVIFVKFEIVVCKLSVWKSVKFVVWERVNRYGDFRTQSALRLYLD